MHKRKHVFTQERIEVNTLSGVEFTFMRFNEISYGNWSIEWIGMIIPSASFLEDNVFNVIAFNTFMYTMDYLSSIVLICGGVYEARPPSSSIVSG